MSSIKKAMILAAGEGTRLRPLTLNTPKTMLLVADIPVIVHIIHWLKLFGINEIGINLHYLGDRIVSCLGDGVPMGVKIEYSKEEKILGTAGGVKRMESFFRECPFIVVYGDVLTDFNLGKMIDYHFMTKALATIALVTVTNTCEVGVVELNKEGRIVSFVEKPPAGTEKSHLANGGIYILEPQIFDHILKDESSDFAFDIFPQMLNEGFPIYGYKLKQEDYLIDIGSLDKYRKANTDYLSRIIPIENM
jgi:mannose-1-phosphate guanylyltransferase/phosphomannomutase